MTRFKVGRAWIRSYTPALSVVAGEAVKTGAGDEDWPGWVWCSNADGLGGWLPETCLSHDECGDTAVLLTAFDTVELTVAEDEELEGFEAREGWIWCRNEAGDQGWVPSDCLTPVT